LSRTLHIDEIALKKGHSDFETIIYTETEVLETMSGKKSLSLQEVLKAIPGIGKIQEVCIDLCAPFADAIRQAMPAAEIVVDRFHLIKLLNKTLETLRNKTHAELKKAKKEKRFASIRFLLFKDYQGLNRDGRRLVREYLRLNSELKTIYWQIQGFRGILKQKWTSRSEAAQALTEWSASTRKHLEKFVKTLERWWEPILNAFFSPLSNGRAEGVNNKIKLVKRKGFGFNNRLNFKLRIQAACNP